MSITINFNSADRQIISRASLAMQDSRQGLALDGIRYYLEVMHHASVQLNETLINVRESNTEIATQISLIIQLF